MVSVRACSIDGCDRRTRKRGLCGTHYNQQWYASRGPCSIEGCEKTATHREWCGAHYYHWKRHGTPTPRMRGQIVDGKRICPTCEIDKPLDEYAHDSAEKAAYCRPCVTERARQRRGTDSESLQPRADRRPEGARTWVASCECCGADFEANRRRSRYCSPKCSREHKNTANWVHLNNRRMRQRKALVESFDRLEIFERDDWVCQLCEEPIDQNCAWPDPMSASLDHVIPLARGGEHSRANAQAAHLRCNVQKGARVAA